MAKSSPGPRLYSGAGVPTLGPSVGAERVPALSALLPQKLMLAATTSSTVRLVPAQLLCTPDSDIDKSIQELEKLVMITAHPSQQCGNCLNDFRQKAQQELIKRYGDQRLPDVKKDVGK